MGNDGDGIEDDGESDGVPLGTTFRTVAQCKEKSNFVSGSIKAPAKPQKTLASYSSGKLKSTASSHQSGGGRLREIGGAMVGFLPRKLSTISSSKERDIAKSPIDEAANAESSICETTPLRHEEEMEGEKNSNTKSPVEEKRLPPNRTEHDELVDSKNISSSISNVIKSEDTDSSVIQKASSSSQESTDDKSSPSQSSESKESEKSDFTSNRKETIKQAKVRFLESDI